MAGWNAWDDATGFEARDRDCEGYVDHLGKEETRVRWERQLQEIQQSREILNEIYKALAEVAEQTQMIYTDQIETALLHALVSNYEGYKNFNKQRVKGTCEWFLNDDRFLTWRDRDMSKLLWVSADPGCGKSVLSRTLVDEHLLSTKTTPTVCYFFFKDGDKGRMSSHDALSAILHQLFTQDCTGRLISHALPSHRSFGEGLARNFSKMWRILVECAESPDTGEIICVLDALDECEKESRNELFENLRDLYLSSGSPSKLKFLITSRPYDYLEAPFKVFLNDCDAYVRFDGNEKSKAVSEEINLVIDAEISDITGGFTEEHRGWIRDRLRSMEHRTYLWLHLIFNIIKDSPCEYGRLDDVRTLLSELPSEVSQAYEKILSRSKDKKQTEALLGIVLAAERPLRLDEVNVALTVALKKTPFESVASLESHLWPKVNFESVVKNLCGLFISVYDEKLYLIHQTAREFLVHVNPERQGTWEGRLGMDKAHSTMSLVCIHYLLLPDLELPDIESYNLEDEQEGSFICYAAPHWPLHYVSQEEKIADESLKNARLLCMTGKHAAGHAWALELNHSTMNFLWQDWTDLAVASYLKLRLVVEYILAEEKTDVNARGGYYSHTPLTAAASQGGNEIVQILLDNGAEVNARGYAGTTALHYARNEELVQILLCAGADVNSKDDISLTLLYQASSYGHPEIVRILLDNGADVNITKLGRTALDAAKGKPEIQQMLIERGAVVGSEDGNGQTPLSRAVSTSSKVSISTGSVASFDVIISL
ncbi:ankyrin repeat domain-containing protein [Candidatus Bathyarchaeota archaeon]|nr:ankyrin repeat domain-containing protein [Candidatus Bathyarchaeota archaeon]